MLQEHVIAMYVQNIIMPSNAIYKPQMPMCLCGHMRSLYHYISKYASYEPNVINNVTRNIGIHTLNITGICP